MKTRIGWLLPVGLVAIMVLLLAWQHLQLGPLAAELEVLRDQEREFGRLRAERGRLAAEQIQADELQRLRSDRAAIGRMRGEVESLRQGTADREHRTTAKPPGRFGVGVPMPASEWRNEGAATPAAALETVLWAAAGGEVDVLAQRIRFDPAARTAALELLQSLSPESRARHGSPEQLLAFLSIKDIPIGAATVTGWRQTSATQHPVSLSLASGPDRIKPVALVFVRDGEEWKLRATEGAVAKYAAALRGPPAGGGK